MNDEERQKLCENLRAGSWGESPSRETCDTAADEIERLAALTQSDAEPVEWRTAIKKAIDFIANEFRDPSYESEGEWLPPEARRIHANLAAALTRSDAEPHDSDGVTRKDVEGWMRYFDEHAEAFVAAHEAIIRKSDAEPVAWRWRWKHDPPNEWNFAVNEFHGELIIIEPLYTTGA